MSNLRPIEMSLVMELFETDPGWILKFSNHTFAEFFEQEVGIDIYDDVYADLGTSKGKRFRTFLQKGQPSAVAEALSALWEYREAMLRREGTDDGVPNGLEQLSTIVEKLGGAPIPGARKSTPANEKRGPNEQLRPIGR